MKALLTSRMKEVLADPKARAMLTDALTQGEGGVVEFSDGRRWRLTCRPPLALPPKGKKR